MNPTATNSLRNVARLACLALSLHGSFGLLMAADESMPLDPAVEQGREALSSGWFTPPWYDADQDTVQRVGLRKPWGFNYSGSLEWLSIPIWIVIAILIVGLVAVMIHVYLNRGPAKDKKRTLKTGSATTGETRVESLPFQLERRTLSLLDEARNRYATGDYAGAVIYLFSHQLVELDQRRLIHLARGKTNRQYLRELLRVPQLHGLVESTMVAFEEVYFGNRPLDRERFEQCWQSLDQFDSLLRAETAS